MDYRLQSIVLPTEKKHQYCRELFFRRGEGFVDREKRILHMGANQCYDFATYLNSCSVSKWKKYTQAEQFTLKLDVEGPCNICFLGYTAAFDLTDRVEFDTITDTESGRREIKYTFPSNDCVVVSFEITSLGNCILYGGFYETAVAEDKLNDITLSIATTTCRKEDFITKNVELIKNELLSLEDEIADHLYVHVVDNGRTLTEDDINGRNIFLHPNNNSGGSGGFARGMLESMHQTPCATHVLLMDDDVLILPESILRTFRLLRLQREEYKDHFISGAMLYYERPEVQHEDMGSVRRDGIFMSVKEKFDQKLIRSVVQNETEPVHKRNEYSAWWYCCIPATNIEKHGYPLPIFIRGDDLEYSLRSGAKIITMNGICVWHMDFIYKFNVATDLYQQNRNLLIDKSCSDILRTVDTFGFAETTFRTQLLKFDYDGAEVVLMAVEDYLEGPEFLETDRGEEILKRNSQYNEKLVPLNELKLDKDLPLDLFQCFADNPRKPLDTFLRRATYNGHRFWPKAWLRHDLPLITFERGYQAQKSTLQEKLLVVNPFAKTGIIRTIDIQRGRTLLKRFRALKRRYKKEHIEIERRYREAAPWLMSEKFWKSYLDI